MVDRDSLEKALLINVIRQKQWDMLVLNGITENYFTVANRPMFQFIQNYTKKTEYPDIQLVCYHFKIDEVSLQEYIEITDLKGLCNELITEYKKEFILYKLGQLNDYNNEILTDPTGFINRFGDVNEQFKILNYENKSVNLFENIEKISQIDADVISTGFKELDEKIKGWKRGEDLIVFMARPGQGKSWFALKFALHAALKGERVGLYSGEMGRETLQERVLCCAKQEYNWTTEQSMQYIQEHKPFISVLTTKELRRKANVNDLEAMIIRDKLTMLVVDQLSLVEDINHSSSLQLRQHYGNISMDLLDLSIKYDLPVVLMVQSNRSGATAGTSPELENIAESDAVAQNATRVISMRNENGIVTIKIVKNRYGISEGVIRYEVDYTANKYKPVIEQLNTITNIKQVRAKQLFSNKSGGPF